MINNPIIYNFFNGFGSRFESQGGRNHLIGKTFGQTSQTPSDTF